MARGEKRPPLRHQEQQRLSHELHEARQESTRIDAVDQSVIDHEGQWQDGSGHDGSRLHNGFLMNAADAEDSDLRR